MCSKLLTASLKCVRMGLCCKDVNTQRSIATTPIWNGRDPFEDLLNEIKRYKVDKGGSKMFTKDPPIRIKDIHGKQLEPIDINAWADPYELSDLFSNMDFLQRKLQSNECDITKLLITQLGPEESEAVNEPSPAAVTEQEEDQRIADNVSANENVAEQSKDTTTDPADAEKKGVVTGESDSLHVKEANQKDN